MFNLLVFDFYSVYSDILVMRSTYDNIFSKIEAKLGSQLSVEL